MLHQTERVRSINVVETRETVDSSESAVGGDGEDRPLPVTAPKECRAVQLAIAPLHQSSFGASPVNAVEAVQNRYNARLGELEHCPRVEDLRRRLLYGTYFHRRPEEGFRWDLHR